MKQAFVKRNALILAAAEQSGCTRIHSEELNAGQVSCGITCINPFAR